MVNLQDTPSAGRITAADLDEARKHSTGTIWPPRRLAAGMDQQGRFATRQWQQFPDTIQTGWGDDKPLPMPRVVPCSTLARWWLAVRRWLS